MKMNISFAEEETYIAAELPGNIASVNFVNHILTITLAKPDDEITIEPREFIYGAGSEMATIDTLQVNILQKDVNEIDGQIAINISGIIENDNG